MIKNASRRRIHFSHGYVDLIRSGRKSITFRAGRRKLKRGEIVDGVCAEGKVIPLRIVDCRTKPLREVTEEEARADLFENRDVVLEGMRKYYPKMTWDTEISVIRFTLAGPELAPAEESDSSAGPRDEGRGTGVANSLRGRSAPGTSGQPQPDPDQARQEKGEDGGEN